MLQQLDWSFETECVNSGYQIIAGVDEVGMGCLAGSVVAAAVVLPMGCSIPGLNDSKKLSPKQRDELDPVIRELAVSFAVGQAEVEEIDEINIYHAARLAMLRAVKKLKVKPDFILLDGTGKLKTRTPHKAIVKGDSLCMSIAAASIVAKVYRDLMMSDFDNRFPGYGFAQHKGYGTVEHRKNLQSLGPSTLHRKSFSWTPC